MAIIIPTIFIVFVLLINVTVIFSVILTILFIIEAKLAKAVKLH